MIGRRFLQAGGALAGRLGAGRLGLALLLACAAVPAFAAPMPRPADAPDPWTGLSGPEFDHFPPPCACPAMW
ncbi:hypothetical protein UAJ10_29775 [Nitrospirillum sp. BR 11164]|uniref:hypothetical protein n=1 Tax=Nitrospirillum sp. BR 11164 TaxID=3104324 RepID=UPI002AFFB484|nr:hypothetical protein [Nitrospirillum sp. BR 11164]MEA1653194.1 hypothetical protein [Nitrospirillum sp. BR 11164]